LATWVASTKKRYLYIVDRKEDMIVNGGENIFPNDIEDVLYKHPAVHGGSRRSARSDMGRNRRRGRQKQPGFSSARRPI
jgi:acyl-CoA synthetase (AMP-forming)/AMP-acid ligase II